MLVRFVIIIMISKLLVNKISIKIIFLWESLWVQIGRIFAKSISEHRKFMSTYDNNLRDPRGTKKSLSHNCAFNENYVLWESATEKEKFQGKRCNHHGLSRHIKSSNPEMDLYSRRVLQCVFWIYSVIIKNLNNS